MTASLRGECPRFGSGLARKHLTPIQPGHFTAEAQRAQRGQKFKGLTKRRPGSKRSWGSRLPRAGMASHIRSFLCVLRASAVELQCLSSVLPALLLLENLVPSLGSPVLASHGENGLLERKDLEVPDPPPPATIPMSIPNGCGMRYFLTSSSLSHSAATLLSGFSSPGMVAHPCFSMNSLRCQLSVFSRSLSF